MWQRFTLYDARVIGHYLGDVVVLESLALLLPLAVALLSCEWEPASRYLVGVGAGLIVGSGLRMLRLEPGHLSRQQALAVTGLAWVVLGMIGAIPMALSSHYATYLDALFDAVSAFTTTDVAIITDVNHVSHADNMWRFTMNFFGGVGLVVVAMSLGMFGRTSSSGLYASEGHSEHVLPNVVQTARFILKFSLAVIAVFTVVMGVILVCQGMSAPRAFLHGVWLAMSSFMTAGFAPMSTSVVYYHSMAIELLLCVLMIFGSLNFTLQSEAWHGRHLSFFRDTEVRAAVVWWLLLLGVFVVALCRSDDMSGLAALMRTGLFTFVSAATTTGFSVLNSNQLFGVVPSGALLVLAMVMAIGGGGGSTAGGIKIRRVAVIAKSALETMKSAVAPDSVRVKTSYYHLGRRMLEIDEVKEAMTVFILFILAYAVGALAGIAYGNDAVAAITESVAMASNSGMSVGICSQAMPILLKWVYIFEMWAGRLEFVTIIALAIKIFVSVKPHRNRAGKRGRA